MKKKLLCFSVLNKKVSILQFFKQERNLATIQDSPTNDRGRKVLLLTTRARPSDAASNLCLKGFIESFVEETTLLATFMRQNLMLVVVPLLNPDGVMLGNFQSGVSGHDMLDYLNEESKELFPELHYLKRYLAKLKSQGDELVCSIHIESTNQAHSTYMRTTVPSASEEDRLAKIMLPAIAYEWSTFFDINNCM